MKTIAPAIDQRVEGPPRAGVDPTRGLDPAEAAVRFAHYGPNELPGRRRERLVVRTSRQLVEPMSVLLVIAAAVTWFALGEQLDAIAILAIVVANVLIALVQEGRAARALDALRAMETPTAHVVRAATRYVLPAREIVPGDVVVLSAGDRVPADIDLIDASGLEIDESILTGESLPVGKEALGDDPEGPRDAGRAFSGTLVVRGTARGVATRTGPATQLGMIAKHLDKAQPPTPLQRELRRVTTRLGLIAVVVAVGVAAITLLRLGATSAGWQMAFLSGAALAVAAVPEGLPTVVTIGLAMGVRRMASHGAVIRRLPAVETLGSTTVILTDKTGTLTQNRMKVEGVILPSGAAVPLDQAPPGIARRIAEIISLCNDATLAPITGDPMEVALLEALDPMDAEGARLRYPRWSSAPFDPDRKRMSTAHRWDERIAVLTKGAPEVVLDLCTTGLGVEGNELPLSPDDVVRVLAKAAAMAGTGARVIALAHRFIDHRPDDPADEEHDLTLVGLVALRDPVRPEALDAVSEARAAGIHIVMVTGDHPGTALAIAQGVGLDSPFAVTGEEIRERGFPDDLLEATVYARVAPEEKLALAEEFRTRGHVVAVTGDGVNDAPALRRADIGVAMGLSGSDVAREAADMVVTDDNLATIVTAVREGRGVYDNIRKVVEYLLGGNLSEILVVVAGLALFPGLGVPLLPLQLLWINLLTDGFPALALGVDPIDRSVMLRPPRGRTGRLLTGTTFRTLLGRAVLIAGASIGSLAIARYAWGEPWAHARVTMFSVLMTAHLLYAFAVRRGPRGSRTLPNLWLYLAAFGGIALQVAVVSLPPLHEVFGTVHLSLREWLLVAGAGTLPALVMIAMRALPPRASEVR